MRESKKLRIELNKNLSYEDYNVYYIVFNEKQIGYLGVFTSNGKFKYSVKEGFDNYYLLKLLKNLIKKELGINHPILNTRL